MLAFLLLFSIIYGVNTSARSSKAVYVSKSGSHYLKWTLENSECILCSLGFALFAIRYLLGHGVQNMQPVIQFLLLLLLLPSRVNHQGRIHKACAAAADNTT